jgi:hypothetical protein
MKPVIAENALNRRALLKCLVASAFLAASRPTWAEDSDIDDVLSPEYKARRLAQTDASDLLTIELDKTLAGLTMWWLVPPNMLVATERRSQWHYIRGADFGFRRARFWRPLPQQEVLTLARLYPDALCDPSRDWFAYRTEHPVAKKSKVWALPKPAPGASLGMYRGRVPHDVQKRDFSRSHDFVAQSLALLSADKKHRFALYVAYDHETGEIRRFSTVLYRPDWRLVSRKDETFSADDTWCDGCGTPHLKDGIDAVFMTFNMLALRELPNPLLLSDNSTVEGRALSMTTFLADGRFASHGHYEIFIGCPSFELAVRAAERHLDDGRGTNPHR